MGDLCNHSLAAHSRYFFGAGCDAHQPALWPDPTADSRGRHMHS